MLTAQTNALHLFWLASFYNFSMTVYYWLLLWMSILPFTNCLQPISMIDCEDLNGMGTGSLPKNTDNLNDYLALFMVTLSGCLRKIIKETQVIIEWTWCVQNGSLEAAGVYFINNLSWKSDSIYFIERLGESGLLYYSTFSEISSGLLFKTLYVIKNLIKSLNSQLIVIIVSELSFLLKGHTECVKYNIFQIYEISYVMDVVYAFFYFKAILKLTVILIRN